MEEIDNLIKEKYAEIQALRKEKEVAITEKHSKLPGRFFSKDGQIVSVTQVMIKDWVGATDFYSRETQAKTKVKRVVEGKEYTSSTIIFLDEEEWTEVSEIEFIQAFENLRKTL